LNKRQLQKEQTKQLLLRAAFDQFEKNGIMATRMSDIAEAANVSHGTVFVHFATQEVLITTVIEEFGEKMVARIHELADRTGSVREVLQAHLNGIMEYEGFYTRLVIEARMLPATSRNTLIMINSAISHHLSQVAQREMQAGTIAQMPVHLLFNTWMGLVNYYLINGDLFVSEGSVLQQYGQTLLDHYLSLIQSKA
jgi:AcrR family transcriptional regulator